jgi:mannitol PTS system EIIA component
MTATVLTSDRITLEGTARTRDEAIAEAARLLVETGSVTDGYHAAMLEREALTTTYMGNFLAIPHGTNEAKDAILSSAMTLVRYDEPIDWNGNPVRVVAAIAGRNGEHMSVLSALAMVFSDEAAVEQLLAATDVESVLAMLSGVNDAVTE